MEEFIFNKVKEEDLEEYISKANVFNMSDDEIKREKVILTSFEDESLGSSKEKLDIALYDKGIWEWIDIEDKIKDYNEIPVGYLLEDREYSRVLVLIRRMSSMVLDVKKDGYNAYILCKIGDAFKDVSLSDDRALVGLLAKNHIYLDESTEDVKKQIQLNIVEENERILSRLFSREDEIE